MKNRTAMRASQRRRGQNRRGATLVLVAALIVGLLGMAAFAVDLTRVHMGANELQTTADAAALRGALHMQKLSSATLSDSVNAFASRNTALNGTATLTTVPARWVPGMTEPQTSGVSFADSANAVQVTATRSASLFFGKLISNITSTPSRTAVAWIASVGGVTCSFKPIGFPIQNIFQSLGLGAINNRALTLAEIRQLRDSLATTSGRVRMTQILYPKDNGVTPTNETSIYWPLADNMNDYADQMSDGGGCGANAAITQNGSETSAFPGNGGGSNAKKFVDGALGSPPASGDPICTRVANDATCYDPTSGAAGIDIAAAYTSGGTDISACAGSCSLTVRMVASFRIVCVFYGVVNGGGPTGANNANERCPWLVNNFSAAYNKSYNVGTIVGYPVVEFAELGSGVTLGSAPSLSQRLILVK